MPTILITGAARGIGHELVRRAVARNDIVFAVVRKATDRSRFESRETLHVVLMDVADSASVTAGFLEVDRLLAGRPLDTIINAAAISIPGVIELSSVETFEQTLNTNTLGSLRILKEAIPRLRGHSGRLLLLTSLWGKASGALLGSYCASKHAIESLVDTARRETSGMDLHIVLIEPGVVRTEMLTSQATEVEALIGRMSPEQGSLYASLYRRYARLTGGAGRTAISTERCAVEIERALTAKRPRTRYRVGRDAKLVCFLTWALPDRWMDALMGMSLNRKPLETANGRSPARD
jgi:NAD(P)-dependent dehydrogenase (short-subunit alcohol dehydrogenase family)